MSTANHSTQRNDTGKTKRDDESVKSKNLWKTARIETILASIAAGAAVTVVAILLGGEVTHSIKAFETWIGGLGLWAPVVFALLYAVFSSVFVPDILFGIVAGAAFGFSMGVGAVICGSLMGAIIQYTLSRRLLKPAIDRFLRTRPTLSSIQTAVLKQELKLQLLIRLTPLNRAVTSYVLGAAGVRFTRFVTACVALLPILLLEVYVGYAGRNLATAAGRPDHSVILHNLSIISGIIAAIFVMVIVSRMARKAIDTAAAAVNPQ